MAARVRPARGFGAIRLAVASVAFALVGGRLCHVGHPVGGPAATLRRA